MDLAAGCYHAFILHYSNCPNFLYRMPTRAGQNTVFSNKDDLSRLL